MLRRAGRGGNVVVRERAVDEIGKTDGELIRQGDLHKLSLSSLGRYRRRADSVAVCLGVPGFRAGWKRLEDSRESSLGCPSRAEQVTSEK